jgi:poly-beta-1,6-N-acetyl-D-glucosamine synthase
VDEQLRMLQAFFGPILADGWTGIWHAYWFFLLFEFPRFVLTDLWVLAMRWIEGKHVSRSHGLPAYSVVVPVLNEEKTIGATLRSLEEQTHLPQSIILVDDGSTDGTATVCQRFERESSRIHFQRMSERSGKSAALNRGLSLVKTEAVVFVDADTTFDRQAMRELLCPLLDDRVDAVGGVLRVRNRNANLLTEVQALEYGISITLSRQAKSRLGILPIISGAFGAFRTASVRSVGGHDPGPGNDSDLTIDIREHGGRIAFAHEAICHTDAPTEISTLTRQRRRWCRNVVKNRLRKHANLFWPLSRSFSLRNLYSTLDPLLYQVFFSWVWLFYLVGICVTQPHILPAVLIGNACLYALLGLVQQGIVIALSERPAEDRRGLLFIPAYNLYRSYLRFVMLFAQIEEIFTRKSLNDPFAPEKVQKAQPDW